MLSQKAAKLSLDEADEDDLATDSTLEQDDRIATPRTTDDETGPSETAQPSSHVNGQDILEDFRKSVCTLGPGQVVKDASFPLYDAVGALQIMDPKMDSGLLLQGEIIDDGFDVQQDLSIEQVIGVMDQLLAFEMSWHQGFPLATTLFASHYIDRLLWPPPANLEETTFHRSGREPTENKLVHLVLRAYCIATIVTCEGVQSTITSQKYYEEEDFVTNTYNRDLLSFLSCEDAGNLLAEARQFVGDPRTRVGEYDAKRIALTHRLDLRYALLRAICSEDLSYASAEYVGTWKHCYDIVEVVEQTLSIAEPVPQSYNTKLQLRLASNVPPKDLVKSTVQQAIRDLRLLITRAMQIRSIIDFQTGENALTMVRLFSSTLPHPPVFVNCMLQSTIWHDGLVFGRDNFKEMIFRDVDESVLPFSNLLDPINDEVEAPQDPRFKIAQLMDDFARKVGDPFLDIFVNHCTNRSRLRRLLCHSIRDWEKLRGPAFELDCELLPFSDFERRVASKEGFDRFFPLRIWIDRYIIRQRMWIIQLGFELDLYLPDELSAMYWLLARFAEANVRALTDIQDYNFQRGRKLSIHEHTITEARASFHLAAAFSHLYSALCHTSHVAMPFHSHAYSTPSLRYYQRVKPFLDAMPHSCPIFEDLMDFVTLRSDGGIDTPEKYELEGMRPSAQIRGILVVAMDLLHDAKKNWTAFKKESQGANAKDWNNLGSDFMIDVQRTLKACVGGIVAVAGMARILKDNPDSENFTQHFDIEIARGEDAHHPWWLVPKIKVKKETQEGGGGVQTPSKST